MSAIDARLFPTKARRLIQMESTKIPAFAWFLLILLSLIWGSSFILMYEGLKVFDAVSVALIRMSIAAVCLLPFLIYFRKRINLKETGLLLIIGLTGNAIPAYLFAQSETVLPTAVVGVLNSMSPIFTLLMGFLFFKLRFPALNVVGIIIGFIGAAMLALAGSSEAALNTNLSFSLLVVAATLCYGISTNLIKHFFNGRNPVYVATMALSLVGWPSLILLLTTTDFQTTITSNAAAPEAFGYLLILGAVGTAFGVVMFTKMLQASSLIFATSVTYTIPVVAVLWGIFLAEELTWIHGIGFLIILVGVWLSNRK